MNKVEKYMRLDEVAVQSGRVANLLKSKFGVKMVKIDEKRKITFKLSKGIDENDTANFDLIDDITSFLEKSFKGSIVKHDYDKFTVEEL